MKEFDKIIGYEDVKRELRRIIDMLTNRERYERLGVRFPAGVLLHGEPGVGKTLLATAFIRECDIASYIVRRESGSAKFLEDMRATFEEAKRNAPAVILLDDMDKFATEEKNVEEFAVLQALIDGVRGADVFIIATANDIRDFPDSLLRPGRFDKLITVSMPDDENGEMIIKHYMSSKAFIGDINYSDVTKMLSGKTCAELESVINQAAIYAGYDRAERVGMEHLVEATLREAYGVTDNCRQMTEKEKRETAVHEAGHALVSEMIESDSVGLVSMSSQGSRERGGFMLRCKPYVRRPHSILVALGGKAACEVVFGRVASGTSSDLRSAKRELMTSIASIGTYGFGVIDPARNLSDGCAQRQETVLQAELERFMFKAKEIIAENRPFLDALAAELVERETLLASDIARIRREYPIKSVEVG